MRTKIPLALTLTLILTATVYALSLANGFVNLDDPLLVTDNTHVVTPSFSSVWYVLSHFDPELYIPVTFFSFQIPIWILGLHAWHLHLVSLLLHLGSIWLLYAISLRLSSSSRIAALTAALFAVHPLNAEAVLWISARKDLLSGFFALASLLAFLQWKESSKRKKYYVSIVFFALALGSKVSVVTLPIIFLLLLIRDNTLRDSKKALIPFFVLSIIFGVIAIVGKTLVGSLLQPWPMLLMAFRSTFFYLSLIVVPSGFSAVHSADSSVVLSSSALLLSVVCCIGIASMTWRNRKSFPKVWMGFVFFIVMLLPTFSHYTRGNTTFMLGSERYVYLASAGIFFAIASLVEHLYHSKNISMMYKKILASASVVVIIALAYLTLLRTFVFAHPIIFNVDIIQKNPDDSRAYYNLGRALEDEERPLEAENAYSMSIEKEPDYLESLIALGSLYLREGRINDAERYFQKAIDVRPDSFKGYYYLGLAEEQKELFDHALAHYRDAEKIFFEYPEIHLRIATMLGKLQRFDEALKEFDVLASLDPGFKERAEQALKEHANIQGIQK